MPKSAISELNANSPMHVNALKVAKLVSFEAVSSFELNNEMWQNYTERARESAGRLQVHMMRIADGGCDLLWVFLLCGATAECGIGIAALASAKPAIVDDDAMKQVDREEIWRLAELDILEVHV
ncbi:hypothetical protein C8R43DRAFT_947238 [Mycena crocata]|nr:hypothetical protein C8R43DRAFT_947238 [Mycena crocata]